MPRAAADGAGHQSLETGRLYLDRIYLTEPVAADYPVVAVHIWGFRFLYLYPGKNRKHLQKSPDHPGRKNPTGAGQTDCDVCFNHCHVQSDLCSEFVGHPGWGAG